MWRSFRGLARVFGRVRPDVVVGTGGYASAPACVWALRHGLPIAVQEQNSFPGLTTRLLSRWARQVHLGFPEARAHLRPGPRTEVFELGNPIRPPDPTIDRAAARREFGLAPEGLVVLVVGGSQGARAVNEALAAALERVAAGTLSAPPPGMQLLWATGPSHFEGVRERLDRLALPWVLARGYIEDMPRALAAADLAVSRAGAMATAELLAWGIPSVLVPFPAAAANHQEHNAQALAAAGCALHLPEGALTPERLWGDLLALAADPVRRGEMGRRALARARPDAAREIARRLLTLVGP
jgi:UDP-N-acetylglucosamine--N-acetylmuramyl-(pentapeptide) pyrophosphoryl-undecaprenol N-acetylglucosamine transferase